MSRAFLAGGDPHSPDDTRCRQSVSSKRDAWEADLTALTRTSGPMPGKKAGSADRWLAGQLLRGLGYPAVRIVLWSGEEVTAQNPSPLAGNGSAEKAASQTEPLTRVLIRDRATLWKLAARPQLEFGEAYTDQRVEVDGDFADFLISIYRAMRAMPNSGSVPRRWAMRSVEWFESNSLSGSKKHIHHHYDIGNDFYKLWLDEEMVYTLRVLPHAVGHAGRGAAGQDGPCLPQALAAAGRNGGRGGLRLGGAGAAHGPALRRHRSRPSISPASKSLLPAGEPNPRGSPPASNSSRTITATSAGSSTRSSPWACWSTSGPNHYRELGRTIDRCLEPDRPRADPLDRPESCRQA